MSADQKLFFTNISSASLSNSNSWNIIVTHLISENHSFKNKNSENNKWLIIRPSKIKIKTSFIKTRNNRKSDLQKTKIKNLEKVQKYIIENQTFKNKNKDFKKYRNNRKSDLQKIKIRTIRTSKKN